MTYSSRIRLISMGFLTVSLNELPPGVSSLIINSCWMMSCACSTQFSQICPSWPAIRIFTSSLLRPQKEQCKVFFAISLVIQIVYKVTQLIGLCQHVGKKTDWTKLLKSNRSHRYN